MSKLTASLLGRRNRVRTQRWENLLMQVSDRLVVEYGTPTLGNFRDPIKEIFYILLSARTSEILYKRAHRNLFGRYVNVQAISKARKSAVKKCIQDAGLGKKRAAQVVATAKRLVADLGPNPRQRLRRMSAIDSFDYLTRLPGLGPKSAFCVMMCSLDHDVFPVDVNVQRIMERLGILPSGLKHYQAQYRLPVHVPSGLSRQLHVGLVEHGRKICLANRPKCHACVLLDLCKFGRQSMQLPGA